MCNIWQQEKEHEITPLEVKSALSNNLFSEVTAIGLNGGEPTLRSDLPEVAAACIESLPSLQLIALITNGLRPHLVIPAATKLYELSKRKNIKLSIMISLDGLGDTHDTVRGRKGNFNSVQECMQYFQDNSVGDSLSYGCTLVKGNIPHAEKLMQFVARQGIYCRFRVGIPHQRLYNEDNCDVFCLSRQETFHLANFLDLLSVYYETSDSRKIFLRNLRNQIVYQSPRANGCAWQGEGVTLESNGDLSYCAVQSPVIGNLILNPSKASEFYCQSTHVRDNILQTKCDTCLHDYEGKNFRVEDSENSSLSLRKKLISYSRHAIPARIRPFARKTKESIWSLIVRPINRKRTIAVQSFAQYTLRSRKQVFPKKQGKTECIQILIVGWYGTETLGDKAILFSVIDSLKRVYASSFAIDVASIEPYVTANTLEESDYSERVAVITLDVALQHAKDGKYAEAIFAGGPLMSSISYLQNIAQMFAEVRSHGGVCKLWGCGIGPIRNRLVDLPNKIAIGTILRNCSYSVCRDLPSAALANRYSSRTKSLAAILDPAYFWFRKIVIAFQRKQVQCGSVPAEGAVGSQILFALRDLPIEEYFSGLSLSDADLLRDSYNAAARRLIIEAITTFGSVYLQAMHRLACGGDDRLFYARLLANTDLEYLVNWRHEKPVDDVKRFMDSDLCVVMRYHSLVAALAARKPVVPVDYTSGGKVGALCDALGLKCMTVEEFSVLDIFRIKDFATHPSEYMTKLEACERDSLLAYESLLSPVQV